MLEEVNFEAQFAKLPEFNPEQSPSAATNSSLPNSPRAFVQSYRKRIPSSAQDDEMDLLQSSNQPSQQSTVPSIPSQSRFKARLSTSSETPKTPKSAKSEGNKFFGPSFSLESLNDPASFRMGRVF